ncbi:MAG: hypothetical protein K0S25_1449 [Bacillus sp. (in: firmicutes)]|jgi:hypothetical protein|nr:hypothetical protein [Bacillus sp. (in: firmicutes)]
MDEGLKELIDKLSNSVSDENFVDIAYDIVEKIEEKKDAFDAVEPILRIMENSSDVDFGKPGPLVHFVETFYKKGYEEKLVDSIKRQPTTHTVWMLNRIINGSDKKTKKYYLGLLNDVQNQPNISNEIKVLVNQFWDFQA